MRLSDEEAKTFYDAWGALLWWVNEQKKLVPPLPRRPRPDLPIPAERAAKVRDALWEDPELLREFTAKNPAGLDRSLIELVASWKHRRRGDYMVWRHYRTHTLLMGGSGKGFAVLGLYSTWDEILPQAPPVMVRAVLLPFGDRIVHDGLVASYNIHFGPGIRRDYREMVRDLKVRGGPTRSLLPEGHTLDRGVHAGTSRSSRRR